MAFPYAYSSNCSEVTSGTSCTCSIQVEAGDWILATVSTRSATTYPSDWTFLHESGTINLNQRMAFLCKKAQSAGTVSITILQASSGRIYINLIAVRGCNGFEYNTGTEQRFTSNATSFTVARADAPKPLIWGCSADVWTLSGSNKWTCQSISEPVVCLNVTSPRQANFLDADSGSSRTFTVPASSNAIIDCVSIVETSFASSGTWEVALNDIRVASDVDETEITWEAETPTGTAVSVEAKLDGGSYTAVTNGGALPIVRGADLSSRTLYLKITLSTSDSAVTPTVSSLRIRIRDASDYSSIELFLLPGNVNGFQNAVGNITLSYDGTGELAGEGGPVEAFEETFTPTGLTPKPNQNHAEHLEISATVAGILTRIYHTDVAANGHLEITATVSGSLIHVDDL